MSMNDKDTLQNHDAPPSAPESEAGDSRLLPILPMSELVLFPRLIIPLALWEESAQRLVDDTLLKDKIIGILTSRQAATEAYTIDNLYPIGTAAVILKMGKTQEGAVRLLVQGLYRFRVEEIVEFCRKMGYRKIGVAFCGGLFSEANTFVRILQKHGLETVSVCCKVGGVPKEFLGLKDEEKVRVGSYETMCNPIAQASVCNSARTDFNVLVGLCVGHDSLFFKHAKALTTVLVAKDRVLGHNPAAALYGVKVYFQRLIKP